MTDAAADTAESQPKTDVTEKPDWMLAWLADLQTWHDSQVLMDRPMQGGGAERRIAEWKPDSQLWARVTHGFRNARMEGILSIREHQAALQRFGSTVRTVLDGIPTEDADPAEFARRGQLILDAIEALERGE